MSAEYGVLSDRTRAVEGPYWSLLAAQAAARDMLTGNPGTECELMWRDGPERPWYSVSTGLPADTVARTKWGAEL